MSEYEIVIWISLGVAILIGCIFFIMSCIYHVKKGTVIVVEKMQEYYGIYQEGWYWFWPFVYRRVGYYRLETKKEIRLNNGKRALLHYKILDVKKFHYSKINLEAFINKITLDKLDVTVEFLKSNFLQIGVELINIIPLK